MVSLEVDTQDNWNFEGALTRWHAGRVGVMQAGQAVQPAPDAEWSLSLAEGLLSFSEFLSEIESSGCGLYRFCFRVLRHRPIRVIDVPIIVQFVTPIRGERDRPRLHGRKVLALVLRARGADLASPRLNLPRRGLRDGQKRFPRRPRPVAFVTKASEAEKRTALTRVKESGIASGRMSPPNLGRAHSFPKPQLPLPRRGLPNPRAHEGLGETVEARAERDAIQEESTKGGKIAGKTTQKTKQDTKLVITVDNELRVLASPPICCQRADVHIIEMCPAGQIYDDRYTTSESAKQIQRQAICAGLTRILKTISEAIKQKAVGTVVFFKNKQILRESLAKWREAGGPIQQDSCDHLRPRYGFSAIAAIQKWRTRRFTVFAALLAEGDKSVQSKGQGSSRSEPRRSPQAVWTFPIIVTRLARGNASSTVITSPPPKSESPNLPNFSSNAGTGTKNL